MLLLNMPLLNVCLVVDSKVQLKRAPAAKISDVNRIKKI